MSVKPMTATWHGHNDEVVLWVAQTVVSCHPPRVGRTAYGRLTARYTGAAKAASADRRRHTRHTPGFTPARPCDVRQRLRDGIVSG